MSHLRTAPYLLAVPALLASALLPWPLRWSVVTAVVVVFGVPHGALDVEIGRTWLRARYPRAWFLLFATPYLLLVGLVLLAWRWAPISTLAAFLLASGWHFGSEDVRGGGIPALAWGGLPIAAPVLLQPNPTATVLSAIAGFPLEGIPPWLWAGSIAWLLASALILARAPRRDLARFAFLCGNFAILPPLTAFALYFVAVHAPAHTQALIEHKTRAPRVCDLVSAYRLAAPTTALTIAIGAALWPFYTDQPPVRVVTITLQLLAGLTLPHMLLDAWLNWRDRHVRTTAAPPLGCPAAYTGRGVYRVPFGCGVGHERRPVTACSGAAAADNCGLNTRGPGSVPR